MTNYTILDIVGAFVAMAGFAAILFAPGYVLAYGIDLFGFRQRTRQERCAWAIALSFAISPVSVTLLGRVMSLGALAIVLTVGGIVAVLLLAIQPKGLRSSVDRDRLLLAIFTAFGVVAIVGSLVDIQQGSKLYLSVSVLDQAYRVAFVNGIAHTGIPPLNPLYYAGAEATMRYYYFWYAVCAVCMKVAHVSARQALIASSCWVGVGLIAMIALFARHFMELGERLYRFILVGALLLTVTGLDILPVLYNLFVNHEFSGDLEWWSTDQVSSWFDSIAWVPNHTASLLCCLTAFLLLWRTRSDVSRRDRIAAVVFAGIAAASAFGLSIYVAAGFAMVMAGWTAVSLMHGTGRARAIQLAASVGVAGLLLIPYLRELMGSHSGTEGGANAEAAHLFQWSVRKMIDSSLVTGLPALASIERSHPILLDQFVRLVLLVPGYAIELGAYGLVLIVAIVRRKSLGEAGRTALGLAVGSLLLVSFLRSSVIGNNDFGYRAAMIPCFFLLLLTADRLTVPGAKPWINLLLFVGLAGTALQVLMLRVYVPLHVAAGIQGFAGLPEAAYAARTAYGAASEAIPGAAIVQSNLIDPGSYFYVVNMLYSERSMVSDAAVDCGAVFGGDPGRCAATQGAVRRLFQSSALPSDEVIKRCHALGVSYLAVARNDPAWEDRSGWVWTLPEASFDRKTGGSASPSFRVVQCGTTPASPP